MSSMVEEEEEEASQPFYNFLWYILLAIGLVGLSIHSGFLLGRYFEYPKNTEIFYNDFDAEFPEILLCNKAPLMTAYDSKTLPQIMGIEGYRKYAAFYQKIIKFVGASDVHTLTFHQHELVSKIIRASFKNDESMMKVYGMDRYNYILDCRINDEKCNFSTDVVDFIHDYHLKCLKIRSAAIKAVSELSLVISTNNIVNTLFYNPRYTSGISQNNYRFDTPLQSDFETGLLLYLYPPEVYPHEKYAIKIETGRETRVNVEQIRKEFVNLKNRPCNAQEKVQYTSLDGKNNTFYRKTVEDCVMNVFLKKFFEECGCLETVSIPNAVKPAPYCFDITKDNVVLPTIEKRMGCYKRVMQSRVSDSQCKPQCKQVEYTTTTNSNAWPEKEAVSSTIKRFLWSKKLQNDKKNISVLAVDTLLRWNEEMRDAFQWSFTMLRNTDPSHSTNENFNKTDYYDYKFLERDVHEAFKKNFLKLRITLTSGRGQFLKETLSYPLSQVFADCISISGVYLGVSLLSLIEVYSLMTKLRAAIARKNQKQHVSSPDNDTSNNNTAAACSVSD